MAAITTQNLAFRRVNEVTQQVVGRTQGTAAGGVMTGAAVITSDRVLASGASSTLSFQNTFTGTPTGTFAYDGSNDIDPDGAAVAGWTPVVPDVVPANPAGAGGTATAAFKTPYYRWYRQRYTNSGGAGVLVTMAEAKGT